MPHRLEEFEMDEGSLVDRGAHPGAKVLIKKSADPGGSDLYGGDVMPGHDDMDEKYEDGKKRHKKKRPNRRYVTEEVGDGNVPVDGPAPSDEDDEMSDKKYDREALVAKGLDTDVIDYIEQLEGYADELEAQVSKSVEEPVEEPETEPVLDEVIKSLDPAIAEVISKAVSRADELESRLNEEVSKRQAEEDRRTTEKFVGIAKSYRGLPTGMDVEEFGTVLKSLANADAEAYSKVKSVLDAAEQALTTNNFLTAEVGKRGMVPGDGDIGEAQARDLVAKGDAPDIETARVMVLDSNPDLYDATQVPGR